MRDAHVEVAALRAATPRVSLSIEQLVQEVLRRLPVPAQVSDDAAVARATAAALSARSVVPTAEAKPVETEAVIDEVLANFPGSAATQSQGAGRLTAVFNVAGRQGGKCTGIWHKVARGPPAFDLDLWLTTCGWRFGAGERPRLATADEVPLQNYKMLCGKCYPAAKQRCLSAIASVGTSGV